MITGLKPRGFVWIIQNRLAVSDRIGGNGFQHRRVRREEEINWIVREAKVTSVVNLIVGHPNQQSYQEAGLAIFSCPVEGAPTRNQVEQIHGLLDQALAAPSGRALVHRETVDDVVAGLMGGYLMSSGLLSDPIVAAAVIQEIIGRPLGPDGRSLISLR
jgi:hypothetical protein